MINSESLPLMTQTVANQSSIYNNQYQNPTTRLTLEQQYQNMAQSLLPNQQQQYQSNPYDDYINSLNSCSDITKEKILKDERFQVIYGQCTEILNQTLYAQIIPQVLQTQNGRIAFEQLFNTTKSLKEEYTQKDLQKEKTLDLLMQDEVVLRRLQELQNPQTQQPIQNTQQPVQTPQIAPQPTQNAPAQPQQPPAQNTNNYVQKNQNKPNNQHQKPQNGGAE